MQTNTLGSFGVMGVRAVQAGALTRALDRADTSPTAEDYRRAAPFRALCQQPLDIKKAALTGGL